MFCQPRTMDALYVFVCLCVYMCLAFFWGCVLWTFDVSCTFDVHERVCMSKDTGKTP